ncbi:MAG: class I SAM-dependent methyltransferase [Rhodospirillales bacterium]
MTTATARTQTPPTLDEIKAKQQGAWASGDYAVVGTTLQIVGEQLCETIDLQPGSRVLDVAAGNGNATLAAARRYCEVTSTDYVDALLSKGRLRAAAEGLKPVFQTADAEALPFADNSFDVVLSTFGVMFTPDQERAATELLRVCRPGGVIALANWTPQGLIGQMFKTLGNHLPPAPGVKSPARWGTAKGIVDLFAAGAAIDLTPRQFTFRYLSADHFLDVFRTYYGPVHKAFMALGDRQDALDHDLRDLLERFNTSSQGALTAPADYIEAVIRKA